jgi:hypothetical protein
VVSSRLGDSGVLVHLRTNQIFELNATGVRVWELLEQGRRLESIEQTLAAEFDVDAGRVREEVATLVGELQRQGLLDVGEPG